MPTVSLMRDRSDSSTGWASRSRAANACAAGPAPARGASWESGPSPGPAPGPGRQRDEGHDLIAEGGHDRAFGSAHFRAHFRALDRGHGQFLGQVAAPALGVRAGHPVGLRGHRGHQVPPFGRHPGRAHQRGDLGRRGALATLGGEHGDDRLGQLAVSGSSGVEPGPLQGCVGGQLGHGFAQLVEGPVLLVPGAGQEPAGDPRLAAHGEQRVLPVARRGDLRPADLDHGGQPVRLEVFPGQPQRERLGQGRPGSADDPARRGEQPAFGADLAAHQPEHRVQAGPLGHRGQQQPTPAQDPGHGRGAVAVQAAAHLLGDGRERGLGGHREQGDAVPSAGLDQLRLHLAECLPGAEHPGSGPGQGPDEPVGVARLPAPDHAGQHQITRGQVAAGIGQVGGVDMPDHAVHAGDVRQQPEAETGHVEQISYSQRDHLPRTNRFSRTITVPV